MSAQEKITKADVTGSCPDDFVLPAYYAIRSALNAIYESQNVRDTDDHWLFKFAPSVAAGKLNFAEFSKDIETGPSSVAVMSSKKTPSKKAGKATVSYALSRLVPDRFVSHKGENGWGEELDVLVVRRDEIHARKNYLEERSSVSGLAVCRHALERYYERERLTHTEIQERLLKDMANVDRYLAFAVAGSIFSNGDAFSPGAITALPLGDGLLIVRNTISMVNKGWKPSTRFVRKKHTILRSPTDFDPHRSIGSILVEGEPAEGFLMAMGITYLSSDMLRLEQNAYVSLFRSEAEKYDLDDLGKDMGRTWLAHERKPDLPEIKVSPYLPYLLSQMAKPVWNWPPWYSIGWKRDYGPANLESRNSLEKA